MSVPKTTVHEDRNPLASKHDVWSTGKVPCVQAISISKAVDLASYSHLETRISPPDATHPLAALCRRKRVHFQVH